VKIQLLQLLAATLLMAGGTLGAIAAEVEGVRLPERVRLGESELVLNGAGVRTRFFFRVYVGALYLPRKTAAAPAIIDDPGPKRLLLHMLRELSAERFARALEDGLENNHDAAELARLEPRVALLRGMFTDARAGDVIRVDMLPDAGTRITVNGAVRGTVPGADFSRALLRIWLGENPADSDLKAALLGG